jgi:hypothetical protein
MSLTLRNVKGSPLTYTEMDDNLTYLEGVAGATGGTGIFDDLTVSGTSSLGDVVIANSKIVKAANGNSKLDLRPNDIDNTAELSTQDGDIIDGLELDPAFNNNGTRLYSEDTDSGEISSIVIEPTSITSHVFQDAQNNANLEVGVSTSFFTLRNGDLLSGLELDPSENNNGTRIYTEDTDSEQLSQLYLSPQTTQLQSFDSNFSVYNSGISTTFNPGVFGGNDSARCIIEVTNLGGIGGANISATVDLVTDESEIIISADELNINPVIIYLTAISTYADNAAAVAGGLPINAVYKTSTGELRIVV